MRKKTKLSDEEAFVLADAATVLLIDAWNKSGLKPETLPTALLIFMIQENHDLAKRVWALTMKTADASRIVAEELGISLPETKRASVHYDA